MPIKNSWILPAVQSIHIIGIALLVGTIILTDLRLLELVLVRHRLPEVLDRFAPWTGRGLAVMFTTGPILFASDVTRYSSNPAFRFKMIVLTLAVLFHFVGRHRMSRKAGAVISILLWTCVVVGGRAIADFDI